MGSIALLGVVWLATVVVLEEPATTVACACELLALKLVLGVSSEVKMDGLKLEMLMLYRFGSILPEALSSATSSTTGSGKTVKEVKTIGRVGIVKLVLILSNPESAPPKLARIVADIVLTKLSAPGQVVAMGPLSP